jgi:hypothetical protein
MSLRQPYLDLHELNADLAIELPHHPAATAEEKREFIGKLLLLPHRQLGAIRRDIADDAVEQRRSAIEVEIRRIVHFVSETLAQIAERIGTPEKAHGTLSGC